MKNKIQKQNVDIENHIFIHILSSSSAKLSKIFKKLRFSSAGGL